MAQFNISTNNSNISGYIEVTEIIPSDYTSTNKTKVVAKAYLRRTNTYSGTPTSYTGVGLTRTFIIYGEEFTNTSTSSMATITIPNNKSYVEIYSAEKEIEHNADGSKTIEVSFAMSNTRGVTGFTVSKTSGSIALTTIPRESSFSFSDGVIGAGMYISINRASNTFTHNISYKFGNLTGTVGTGIGDHTTWYVPTSLYSVIPNAKSGTGTLTCDTYSGSTKIGTVSAPFKVSCNESSCIPALEFSIEDINPNTIALTGSTTENIVLVDYQSTVKLTLTYSAKNSATIKSILINGVAQTIGTVYNLTSTFDKITVEVIDSRGYPKKVEKLSGNHFKRIQYVPLSISSETSRSSQIEDDMFAKISGVYYNGNFSDTLSNELNITWKVREKNGIWQDGTTPLVAILKENENIYTIDKTQLINPITTDGTWSYQKIYEFEFVVTDKLTTKTGSDTRPKGQYNFAIFKDQVILPSGNPILDYEIIGEIEVEE